MMKLSHRSILTGFLISLFCVFLIGKLDGKSSWNWFVVLTPIWLMDLITFLIIYTKRKSDFAYQSNFNPIVNYCLVAKLLFQLLLCVRLEIYRQLPIYIVMSPLWCLLIMLACNLFQKLISSTES